MGWVKGLIITMGLLLVARVALARDIEHFTDKQGTVHITNLEPKGGGNRAKPDRPEAPLPPAALPAKSPDHPAAMEPAPPAPPPDLKPRMAPNPPPPRPRGRPPKGLTEARPDTDPSAGKDEAAVQVAGGRDSPMAFLSRIPPFVQFCVLEAAQLYGLPVPLVLALIRQESNFAPLAVSPKGAMGLMQLMPGTAALLGVRDPFAPRENILAGCRYFRFLLNYFQGSVPLALAAYNAGSQRVVSAGYRVPAIQETQEFVTRVMGLYCFLEKHAANL